MRELHFLVLGPLVHIFLGILSVSAAFALTVHEAHNGKFAVSPSSRPLELARRRARRSLPEPLPSTRSILPANIARAPSPLFMSSSDPGSSSQSILPAHNEWTALNPGPSSRESSVIEHHEQERILLRLMRGEGISAYDNMDLIEQCDKCQHYFLSVHLRPHVKTCAEVEEDDPAESLRRYRQRDVSVEV